MLRSFGEVGKLQDRHPTAMKYSKIESDISTLLSPFKVTKGPGTTRNKTADGCPMISIVVTPSTHINAGSMGLELSPESRVRKRL
jgi:hypothetical protein